MAFRHAVSCLILLASAALAHAQRLAVCADRAGMPPFGYSSAAPGSGAEVATGVTVDLLKLIAANQQWTLKVDLLPWARCLLDAQGGRYSLVLNVVRGEAKAGRLLLSKPFYNLHGVYVYSGRNHPQGLAVASRQQLLNLKICGMGGHRFEAFGLPTDSIDRGTSRGFEQLVAKLHLGRCDVVIGTREEIAGTYLKDEQLSAQIANGSLRMLPLPNAPEPSLHFGVPESLPGAEALVTALNEGLDRLARQGAIARLIDQHLNELNLSRR